MKCFFERIGKDIKAYGVIIGILVVLWVVLNLCIGTACITVFVTGLPCPGCGMGHAFFSLLTGDIAQAHLYNPSVWGWLAFGLCFFLYRYVLGKRNKYIGWILTFVALLSVAIYLYRMINLFPTEPPLTYYEGNLFQRIFPKYGEWIQSLFD
ncbi:MAG: DUF2752 domain-containing protein [Lachnospiraceae bacterium]|nr:DUF2752 domain-containing protein [Lachnospiraceae bacterium]